MVMRTQSESGITRAALATALLFLMTTVIVAVWGGMQYRALRASDAEREALGQRVDALRQEAAEMVDIPISKDPPNEQQTPSSISATSAVQPPQPLLPGFGSPAKKMNEPVSKPGNTSEVNVPNFQIIEIVDQYFGRFLEELAPEKQKRVKPLLISLYEEYIAMGRRGYLIFQSGKVVQMEKDLREKLAKILSAEEMVIYDEHQYAEAIKITSMMLNFNESDHIDAETLVMAKDVMAEEFIAAKARALKLPPRQISSLSVAQPEPRVKNEAMRNARIKLSRMLSPEELRDFDRYVVEDRAMHWGMYEDK